MERTVEGAEQAKGRSGLPDMLDYDLERKRVKMLPGQPGSRSLIRDLNVSLLIELVRRFGLVSRADLARESQLSAPTARQWFAYC